MPSDIRLDPLTHDLDLSSQGLEIMTDNPQEVAQRVKITLLLRAGEWFLDTTKGVPYVQFGRFKADKAFADAVLVSTINSVEGVDELLTYESEITAQRVLDVRFSIKTYSGEIIDLFLEI